MRRSDLSASIHTLDELLGGGAVQDGSDIQDSFEIDREPYWKTRDGLETAKRRALESNAELFSAKASLNYAQMNRKTANSSLFPKLDLHGSLNATASASEKGNPEKSNQEYFRVGAALSWNIFNGLADDAKMETAKIAERTAQIQMEKVRLNVETRVANAVDAHLRALESLDVAEGNDSLAFEMLELGRERLKEGRITNFEFRETQSQWRSAREALLSAKVAAAKAEIQVKLLTGDVLENGG